MSTIQSLFVLISLLFPDINCDPNEFTQFLIVYQRIFLDLLVFNVIVEDVHSWIADELVPGICSCTSESHLDWGEEAVVADFEFGVFFEVVVDVLLCECVQLLGVHLAPEEAEIWKPDGQAGEGEEEAEDGTVEWMHWTTTTYI